MTGSKQVKVTAIVFVRQVEIIVEAGIAVARGVLTEATWLS
jgi:hypothetical protein